MSNSVSLTLKYRCQSAWEVPFRFYENPTADSIFPSTGSSLGGTFARVLGSGFDVTRSVIARLTGRSGLLRMMWKHLLFLPKKSHLRYPYDTFSALDIFEAFLMCL